MLERADIYARLKTFEDFLSVYRDGDANLLFNGDSLITNALANTKMDSRYKIANFVLDRNPDASRISLQGNGTLHILLGHREQDWPQTCALAKRLIAGGADVNALDKKGRLPLAHFISFGYTDKTEPLWDLFLSQPNLDLNTKSKYGYSLLDSARSQPWLSEIADLMEAYLEQQA